MTKSDSSENVEPKRLLDGIRSPADVKALREQDLPQLAQEVRDELVKVLSQTGGHLGPNNVGNIFIMVLACWPYPPPATFT